MADFHIGVLFYTRRARDLWRKRYWVGCPHCDRKVGPFDSTTEGNAARRLLDLLPCPTDRLETA